MDEQTSTTPDDEATRLADKAKKSLYAPRTAAAALNAIVELGPAQAPKAHEALAGLQAAWAQTPLVKTCLGVYRRPLAQVDAAFAPDVVSEALRSLRVDPARFLPHRDEHWKMRREERVVEELLGGTAEQREQLTAALEELVDDATLPPLLRHRALHALERADAAAAGAARERLRAANIDDPGEPVPNAEVVAKVEEYWDRIERALAAQSPHLLADLGPALPPADVTVCRQILGIPDAFAASLARHRYVALFPEDVYHEDVRNMLADVDEEWWQDDGDWGDLPDCESDATWLGHLRAYAEKLEAAGH